MKKIYQLSLAAALLLSPIFAATSFAQTLLGVSWSTAESFEMPSGVDGASSMITYKLKISQGQGQAIVTGMNMSYTSVKIPTSFSKSGVTYKVIGIADDAFNTTDGKNITSITLPSTITTIGNNAFYGGKLTSITLPSSLQVIGSYAFYNVPLTSLTIPSNVTTIGDWAFRANKIKILNIPNSVTTIGANAFYNSGEVREITIGTGVKTIKDGAFAYLMYNTPATERGNVKIPNNVTSLGKGALAGCCSPSIQIGTGITSIESDPWHEASNTSNTNVKKSLKTLILDGVTSIPDGLCKGMTNLQKVEMNKATSIGASAFEGTGLTSVELRKGITSIGASAFANCSNLAIINFFSYGGTVGNDAFLGIPTTATVFIEYNDFFTTEFGNANANPAAIVGGVKVKGHTDFKTSLNSSIAKIGAYAANKNHYLKSVTLNSAKSIGLRAFSGAAVETLDLTSNTGINLGQDAFRSSSLKSIINPSAIKMLTIGAFGYTDLTSISEPFGCTYIPDQCFDECSKLTSINLGNITQIGKRAFENCTSWKNNLVNCNSLQTIEEKAFRGCTSLESVDIEENVKTIGSCAFQDCSKLAIVHFGKSLTTVGESAFDHCNITKLVVTDLKTLCNISYTNGSSSPLWSKEGDLHVGTEITTNNKITTLTIPSGVTRINYEAFAGCKNVTTLIVPEGVTELGNYCFNFMRGLTKIELPSTLTTVGQSSFYMAGSNATATTINCAATKVPFADANSFDGMKYANCTLNVPGDTKSKYAAAAGWKNFASKTIQNCAAPEISTLNGKVVFKTTTLGAKVMYSVEYGGTSSSSVTTDSSTGTATSTWITPSLKITAYASKADHANSPSVTKTITLNTPGLKGDVNLDGVVNITDVTSVVNTVLGK